MITSIECSSFINESRTKDIWLFIFLRLYKIFVEQPLVVAVNFILIPYFYFYFEIFVCVNVMAWLRFLIYVK